MKGRICSGSYSGVLVRNGLAGWAVDGDDYVRICIYDVKLPIPCHGDSRYAYILAIAGCFSAPVVGGESELDPKFTC